MNYIVKLQKENEMLKQAIQEIRIYLNSNKFDQDIMVNKNDILLRLNEAQHEINEVLDNA